MSSKSCGICQNSKIKNQCQICGCDVCKTCVVYLDEGHFEFETDLPENLTKQIYCLSCHKEYVEDFQLEYDKKLSAAKEIMVFNKDQAKETHYIKRNADPIKIVDCEDKNLLVLKMAYIALTNGYNAIIDLELTYKKVKDGTYQTHLWSGNAIPAHVDESKLLKDRSLWSAPN